MYEHIDKAETSMHVMYNATRAILYGAFRFGHAFGFFLLTELLSAVKVGLNKYDYLPVRPIYCYLCTRYNK